MTLRTTQPGRSGITLFEVVIAMVIFALTLPALNTLVQVGTQRAEESAYLSRASMECRGKLAEVTVGAQPMETTDWTGFDQPDMVNWSWKLTANDGDVDGLKQVQVSVKFDPGANPTQVTLSQYIIDPATHRGSTLDRMILKAHDDANAQAATPSTDDSGTTGSAAATAPTTGTAAPAAGANSNAGKTTTGTGASGATGTGRTGSGATPSSGTTTAPSSGTVAAPSSNTGSGTTGGNTGTRSTGTGKGGS